MAKNKKAHLDPEDLENRAERLREILNHSKRLSDEDLEQVFGGVGSESVYTNCGNSNSLPRGF